VKSLELNFAKETADMVLTDDNYNTLWRNRTRPNLYSNIGICYYLLPAIVREHDYIHIHSDRWPSPLTAIQLLWQNLVTIAPPCRCRLLTENGDRISWIQNASAK
jgi:magnesium-transporting ATPase (P-type)